MSVMVREPSLWISETAITLCSSGLKKDDQLYVLHSEAPDIEPQQMYFLSLKKGYPEKEEQQKLFFASGFP